MICRMGDLCMYAKIMIVGYAGAGKTTLAKVLQNKYNISSISLDDIHFTHGEENSIESDRMQLKNFMDNNEKWIIDGNYTYMYFERRLEEADVIIFLNYNVAICLFQAVKRYFVRAKNVLRNEHRVLKPDWGLIYHIAVFQRTIRRRTFEEMIKNYKKKVIILNNRKETLDFLISQEE